MKINSTFSLVVAFAVSILMVSCNKSSDPIKGDYQSGVLVANEGNFSASNGDVTYYNPSSGLVDPSIFEKVNGSFAGKVLQSITVDGDVGYLVLNGDNKIEIININTFKLTNTFTNPILINPRYLQVINGKAYISAWGAYDQNYSLVKSYVLVMDTKTLQLVDTIGTGIGAENLLYNGKYLFAANNNFGGSNTVTVIDPATNKAVSNIVLAAGPSAMALDVNNKLWVLTSGSSTNYVGNNDGKLFCVNAATFAIEKTIELKANPGTDLGLSPDKSSLYYYVNNVVYKFSITSTTAPATAWSNTSLTTLYALGVDPKTGEVYLGDALNYASDGKVYRYNTDGTPKTSFTAGISPGQFIFR